MSVERRMPIPGSPQLCGRCCHLEAAHDENGCQTVVHEGRSMETDPDYCECSGFVITSAGQPQDSQEKV